MGDIGWRPAHRRVDAETARRSILAQHERIRDLLERARLTGEAALDGAAGNEGAVASAVGDIRTTMEAHLAFEESVLLPILGQDPTLGTQRAARLVDEHRHQRAMLTALHDEARAAPWVATLAAKLVFLTDWLLADMSEEESSLLTPDVIRDGVDLHLPD
jgi:hypothetical protein